MEVMFEGGNCSNCSSHIPILTLNLLILGGSLVGICSNLLIFVVINNIRNSIGSCNLLVKQLALSDVTSCTGFIICIVPALVGEFDERYWHIPQHYCGVIASVSLIGMGTGAFLTLLVSLDRCYAVFAPKRYILTPNLWAKLAVIFVWLTTVSLMVTVILLSNPSHKVPICMPPFVFTQTTGQWWNGINLATNLLVLMIYLVVLVRTKRHSLQQKYPNRQRRLYRLRQHKQVIMSLTVIIVVHLTTWLAAHIITATIIMLRVPRFTGIMIITHVGILASLNINLDLFIYYWMSQDFRQSLHRLPIWKWLCGRR